MTLPYAVICPTHGQVFLTFEEHDCQMDSPDDHWICPMCGLKSEWDDENYKNALAEEIERENPDEPDCLRTLGFSESDFR